MSDASTAITLDMMRASLSSALVCDALDSLGVRGQSPAIALPVRTVDRLLVGRCKTTLWNDRTTPDPHPYENELLAVDTCLSDQVMIAAAAGSLRSGIWGELLSTAARNSGCVGAIVDGAVRDLAQMKEMRFPVFARGACPYDSKDRQEVTAIDVAVEIAGVVFQPNDLVFADADGIVVVPAELEAEAIRRAWTKAHDENRTRSAIQQGMKVTEAYRRYGVL
ncbi:MAG TPA: RraA family protein [Planctomycetaceae bacterium]|jgi:4-hydroxy-4-methyl-2-oxoglutarate aldolase|nr:RraA family protein [Planctomycetaceae bacterium]